MQGSAVAAVHRVAKERRPPPGEVDPDLVGAAGVVGTICAVKEETIVIETSADRVRIEFTKWAVSTKGKQADETAK